MYYLHPNISPTSCSIKELINACNYIKEKNHIFASVLRCDFDATITRDLAVAGALNTFDTPAFRGNMTMLHPKVFTVEVYLTPNPLGLYVL